MFLYSKGVKKAKLEKCENMNGYWKAIDLCKMEIISICQYDDNHLVVGKGYLYENGHIKRIVLFENGKEKKILKSFSGEENMVMMVTRFTLVDLLTTLLKIMKEKEKVKSMLRMQWFTKENGIMVKEMVKVTV